MADPTATELGWDAWLRSSDREVLSHLLADSEWRGQAEALLKRRPRRVTTPRADGAREASSAFRRSATHPFGDSLDFIRHQLSLAHRERGSYRKLLEEILSHTSEADGNWLTGETQARLLPLAEHLLDTSRESRFDSPQLAESLARLATSVCEYLEPAIHTGRLVLDLKARCWTCLGNALRLQEDHEAAEAALHRAGEYLRHTLDLKEKAEHFTVLAALRTGQRRFAAAGELLDRAANLCREVGDQATLARILTSIGSHALDEGSPSKATAPLREALDLVDQAADPRTTLFIFHNLTLCLAELERFEEARRMRDECEPFYQRFDDPVVRNRRIWLDGILASGLGHGERAEELLRRVLATYSRQQQHRHAVCVGLDLAAVYACQGDQGKLHELAEELAALCLAGSFQREARAALHFFIRAVESERASVAMARRVELFIRRSARNPEVRFSPVRVAPPPETA